MALCFASGSSQFAELPSVYTDLLASTTNFTLSIWFRVTNASTEPFLWSTKGAGVARSFLELRSFTGFYWGTNTNGNFITTDGRLTRADTWTHLVVVRSSATGLGSIWVNGVSYFSATLPAHASGSGDLYLGRWDSGLYLSGKLYDFQIFTSALGRSDIRRVWAGQNVTTSRVARWLMSEVTGTSIADTVGGRTGTTFGATWDTDAPTFGELDSAGSSRPVNPFMQQVIG